MQMADIFLTFRNTATSLKQLLKLNNIPIKAKVVFLCLSTIKRSETVDVFADEASHSETELIEEEVR